MTTAALRASMEAGSPALACERAGAGHPLVLLHGGVGSASHWHANLPALARHFEVIAVDLPGYGRSPDVPRDLDPDGYVAQVAEGLGALVGDGPAGLVGFSFGAVIAAAVAARGKIRLDRISLLAPGGFGVPVGRTLETRPVPKGAPDDPTVRAAVAFNLGQWMLARAPSHDDPVVDLHIANLARARYDSRRISLQDRLEADLARIAAPMQLIWGAEDRLAFPSIGERIERCRRAGRIAHVAVLPGAGHWVQHDAADAVNQLLIDFHTRPDDR